MRSVNNVTAQRVCIVCCLFYTFFIQRVTIFSKGLIGVLFDRFAYYHQDLIF
jgi:hypothetical protein